MLLENHDEICLFGSSSVCRRIISCHDSNNILCLLDWKTHATLIIEFRYKLVGHRCSFVYVNSSKKDAHLQFGLVQIFFIFFLLLISMEDNVIRVHRMKQQRLDVTQVFMFRFNARSTKTGRNGCRFECPLFACLLRACVGAQCAQLIYMKNRLSKWVGQLLSTART